MRRPYMLHAGASPALSPQLGVFPFSLLPEVIRDSAGQFALLTPSQRMPERDIIQMLPVSSTSTIAIRPTAADHPPFR